MSLESDIWRLSIDTGGTFTDCLAVDPAGCPHRVKVLSSGGLRVRVVPAAHPSSVLMTTGGRLLPAGFFTGATIRPIGGDLDRQLIRGSSSGGELRLDERWMHGEVEVEIAFEEEAPVLAARIVTGTVMGDDLPPMAVRFATTRGTNALLERSGKPPAFFVTRGFRDLLEIGNQQRPDLFALRVERREVLHGPVIEVDERLAADGAVEVPLSLERVDQVAKELLEAGHRNAAVALLHSYRNPRHERDLADRLVDLGFTHVSVSSELSPRLKIVPRAEAAVIDAYLAECVGDYLASIAEYLHSQSFHVMTSAGGLVRGSAYRAKDSLLSGPAGGVIGAVAAGRSAGVRRLLAFDMGGTSTDVTRYDGELEYRTETRVGGVCLSSPSLAVETVAAGGGSICRFDGRQLKVGPDSAGALPGPACYGNGGPLTLTDVNLLLGRLPAARFPFRVSTDIAEERAREIASAHTTSAGPALGTAELLFGFLRIANEKMAGAVRAISLRAGYRPDDYTLLTFGGAGPQHACALADLLQVEKVVVPGDAALLSAFGLGQGRIERFAEEQVLRELPAVEGEFERLFDRLVERAAALLAEEGVSRKEVGVDRREVFARFTGQEATLEIEWQRGLDVRATFEASYETTFGYRPAGREIEIESLRLIASDLRTERFAVSAARVSGATDEPIERSSMYTAVGWVEAQVLERRMLRPGATIFGPALIVEDHTATVVEPGWRASVGGGNALVLERV